ncbi:MAG TPA: hypothetical protein VMV86_00775 [Methanosarcinales archaeon]|nr:hypothetical protein [Methanosarcinales archaeon]
MVRAANDRINKYTAKIVGDVVKNRIDAQKDFMVAQAAVQFASLATEEAQIAAYTDPLGLSPMLKPFYMSYGRKLHALKRKHTDVTLHDEACIATVAWSARGLDLFHLATIALNIYSIDVFDCTA